MDIGAAYRDTRERLTGLLKEAGEGVADTPVPACPAWTVRDVTAHLAGTCTDILNGNLDGVATDEWTAAQIDARKGRPMIEIIEEWNQAAEQCEPLAEAFPPVAGRQWVADQHTHEHDIRGALRAPGGRDGAGLEVGVTFFVTAGFASSISARGAGPIEVRTPEGDRWVVGTAEAVAPQEGFLASEQDDAEGDDPPRITLTAPRFELFRALTGRRSRAQIASFDWSDDAEPYLDLFEYGPFTIRSDDLVE